MLHAHALRRARPTSTVASPGSAAGQANKAPDDRHNRLLLRYLSPGLTKRLGAAPSMRLNAWLNALGDW